MAGKTVSAYVDEETVRLVEHAAALEDRPVSQIVAAALAFYARLPAEAHTALRTVKAYGGPDALRHVTREVARVLTNAQFALARQRLANGLRAEDVEGVKTEEDLLTAAARLTDPDTRPVVDSVEQRPVADPTSRRKSRRSR